MKNCSLTLNQLLASDIPPRFGPTLLEIMPNLYRDAHAAVFENPCLGEPEANYLLGHQRRAMIETALRNLAGEHGLRVVMERPEQGGCQHVRIIARRFSLTACHVTSRGAFPRHSFSREQYSLINEHVSQGQLFPIDSNPTDAELYGIIVHTEIPGRKDEFQCVSVGFPNHEFTDWIQEPIDLTDLVDIQQRMFRKPDDLQAQVQIAEPVLKSGKFTSEKSNMDK